MDIQIKYTTIIFQHLAHRKSKPSWNTKEYIECPELLGKKLDYTLTKYPNVSLFTPQRVYLQIYTWGRVLQDEHLTYEIVH